MIEEGDTVTIQSGMFAGKEGEVREIDRQAGIVTVAVEGFGAERETRVALADVEVAGAGDVDELWAAVEESVREAIRQPFAARRNLWWARRAERGEQASPELLDDFGAFRDDLEEEFEERAADELAEIEESLDDADAGRLQRWLAGAANDLEREWRERTNEVRREFLEETVTDEQLRRMRQEASEEEDASGLLDEQAKVDRATGRMVSVLVDEGLKLWESCQEQKSLEEARGYAWASVAAGPVDLPVLPPEDERPEVDEVEWDEWTMPGDAGDWKALVEGQLAELALTDYAWRGLTTRSGSGEGFPENPWDVARSADVTEALQAIWGPLEERAANVCEELSERCLAVAQLEADGDPLIVYLLARPVRDAGRESAREAWTGDVPYDELVDRFGAARPTLLMGAPPDDTLSVELEEGESFDLPMGLRELRARHGILRAPMLVLGGEFETLAATVDDPEAFRAANDGASPDRFVAFGRDEQENRQVFDRDDLDMRHDPKAAGWARESGAVGERYPFWLYADAMIRGMMGLAVD